MMTRLETGDVGFEEAFLAEERAKGRATKLRVRVRLREWQECRRLHGRVPVHVALFLERARENHERQCRRVRWLHGVVLRGGVAGMNARAATGLPGGAPEGRGGE